MLKPEHRNNGRILQIGKSSCFLFLLVPICLKIDLVAPQESGPVVMEEYPSASPQTVGANVAPSPSLAVLITEPIASNMSQKQSIQYQQEELSSHQSQQQRVPVQPQRGIVQPQRGIVQPQRGIVQSQGDFDVAKNMVQPVETKDQFTGISDNDHVYPMPKMDLPDEEYR